MSNQGLCLHSIPLLCRIQVASWGRFLVILFLFSLAAAFLDMNPCFETTAGTLGRLFKRSRRQLPSEVEAAYVQLLLKIQKYFNPDASVAVVENVRLARLSVKGFADHLCHLARRSDLVSDLPSQRSTTQRATNSQGQLPTRSQSLRVDDCPEAQVSEIIRPVATIFNPSSFPGTGSLPNIDAAGAHRFNPMATPWWPVKPPAFHGSLQAGARSSEADAAVDRLLAVLVSPSPDGFLACKADVEPDDQTPIPLDPARSPNGGAPSYSHHVLSASSTDALTGGPIGLVSTVPDLSFTAGARAHSTIHLQIKDLPDKYLTSLHMKFSAFRASDSRRLISSYLTTSWTRAEDSELRIRTQAFETWGHTFGCQADAEPGDQTLVPFDPARSTDGGAPSYSHHVVSATTTDALTEGPIGPVSTDPVIHLQIKDLPHKYMTSLHMKFLAFRVRNINPMRNKRISKYLRTPWTRAEDSELRNRQLAFEVWCQTWDGVTNASIQTATSTDAFTGDPIALGITAPDLPFTAGLVPFDPARSSDGGAPSYSYHVVSATITDALTEGPIGLVSTVPGLSFTAAARAHPVNHSQIKDLPYKHMTSLHMKFQAFRARDIDPMRCRTSDDMPDASIQTATSSDAFSGDPIALGISVPEAPFTAAARAQPDLAVSVGRSAEFDFGIDALGDYRANFDFSSGSIDCPPPVRVSRAPLDLKWQPKLYPSS